jgi:hypothetical protein
MADTALSAVLKELAQRRSAVADALTDGAARDFSEYKSMTGEIRGLSLAHSLITDLVRRLEKDDE